jgi:hypothetical protein
MYHGFIKKSTLKRRRQFLPMPEGRGILAEIGDE